MADVILFIWQLPQNIIGLVVRTFFSISLIRRAGSVRIYSWRFSSGVSLGAFCFVCERAPERVIAHEYGHTRQSVMLGPLYLFVIGLPSLVWAFLYGRGIIRGDYYRFYTERWAERLGSSFNSFLQPH